MKALVKSKSAPGIWLEDIPVPTCGVNDVLIKISSTAICGTDIHIYRWDEWASSTIPLGMAVGHEFCGEIVEVGSEVKGFSIGDKVSGEGHLTCGHCRNCRAGKQHLCRNTLGVGVNRPGAFAEYLSLPASNVIKLPAYLPSRVGAILDPLGNAVHTALSYDLVGEDILITGAGPIGIMSVAIAKFVGARHVVITDVNDYRLELARSIGATRAINLRHQSLDSVMHELDMKEGFDIGLEMSGNALAIADMISAMNHGGRIALLGIAPADTTIDMHQVIFKGLEIKGIYGREMYETWYKMLSMLQSGLKIETVITHEFEIHNFEKAFQLMASGQSGKVIINW